MTKNETVFSKKMRLRNKLNYYANHDEVLHYHAFEKLVMEKIWNSVDELDDEEFELMLSLLEPKMRKEETVRCYECGSVVSIKNTTHKNTRIHKDAVFARYGVEHEDEL